MAITPLSPLDRTSPSFRGDVDTFFGSGLPQLVTEINTTEGAMSALAAGGAYAFPYIFDSATADADPGVGKLRLGSATQSASIVLRIDTAIVGGVDIAAVFTDLLAGTSATKGSIRLVKAGDPSKWMIFDVTGGSGSGYRNLNVSARAFSAASPFANGDSLIAYVERAGDKGEIGTTQTFAYMKVSDRKATNVGGGASSSSSTQGRVLNTVESNTIAGASLSANSVTLPAGIYDVRARAPGVNCSGHRLSLYNTTDSTVTVQGATAHAGATVGLNTDAVLSGRFTIAAQKVFTLRHYTAGGDSNGMGLPSNQAGVQEIYAELELTKVG